MVGVRRFAQARSHLLLSGGCRSCTSVQSYIYAASVQSDIYAAKKVAFMASA
jgi:hypothetical protein